MDPYVKATLGNITKYTHVEQNKGKYPQWSEIIKFNYNNEGYMKLDVYDKDVIQDDYVGGTLIDFNNISNQINGPPNDYPILLNNQIVGSVKLMFEIK